MPQNRRGGEKLRYYIADLHFFHGAMNEYMDRRGFAGMLEMNEYMIKKWNGKVSQKDDVVILGDLSWGNAEETNSLLKRLKGKLYLIRGNHDRYLKKQNMELSRFEWVKPYEEMMDNRRKVILCHYPIICYNGQYRLDEEGKPRTYMLYGHVHDTMDQRLIEQFQDVIRRTEVVDAAGIRRAIPSNMIVTIQPRRLDEKICRNF